MAQSCEVTKTLNVTNLGPWGPSPGLLLGGGLSREGSGVEGLGPCCA